MALVKCPNCLRVVSSDTVKCPKCNERIHDNKNVLKGNYVKSHPFRDYLMNGIDEYNLIATAEVTSNSFKGTKTVGFFEDCIKCSEFYSPRPVINPRIERTLFSHTDVFLNLNYSKIVDVKCECDSCKKLKVELFLEKGKSVTLCASGKHTKDLRFCLSILGRYRLKMLAHKDKHNDLKEFVEYDLIRPGQYILCEECGALIHESCNTCDFCKHIIKKQTVDQSIIDIISFIKGY